MTHMAGQRCVGVICEYSCYRAVDGIKSLWCEFQSEVVLDMLACPQGHWVKDVNGVPLSATKETCQRMFDNLWPADFKQTYNQVDEGSRELFDSFLGGLEPLLEIAEGHWRDGDWFECIKAINTYQEALDREAAALATIAIGEYHRRRVHIVPAFSAAEAPSASCIGVTCGHAGRKNYERVDALWCGLEDKPVYKIKSCPLSKWQKDERGFPLKGAKECKGG